jgi:hypothetical protein
VDHDGVGGRRDRCDARAGRGTGESTGTGPDFLYPQLGGIHHIYANPKALAALTGGRPYGSVLVLDVLEARAESRAIVESARRFVLVMEKDQKRFPRTGGWGYEAFTGDTRERTVKDGGARCHDCHRARRSHDYVLHDWRP